MTAHRCGLLILCSLNVLTSCVNPGDGPPDAERVRKEAALLAGRKIDESNQETTPAARPDFQPFAYLPVVILVALGFAATLVWHRRGLLGRPTTSRDSADAGDETGAAATIPPAEDTAFSCASRGDFNQACMILAGIVVARFEPDAERRAVLSNREIERLAPWRLRPLFRAICSTAERADFGGELLGPADWQSAQAAWRELSECAS